MKRYQSLLIGFFLCFLCAAGTAAGSALEVFVSIPPLKYLADQVGGNWVHTHVLVASGQDPHTFAPRPAQIRLLARARVYFTVGLAFEHSLVDRFRQSLPGLHIVDLAAALPQRQTFSGHHPPGQNEPEDPHIWLDPQKLQKMARVMASVLRDIDPAHAVQYQANLQRVEARLEKVYTTIKAQLAPYAGSAIYVFHPAFGHFVHAFGLRQEAVERHGRSPAPRQLANLIAQARRAHVRVVFVQPQFDHRAAVTIARAIGARIETLDPLAEDVVATLLDMATKIAAALQKRS